MCNNKPCGDCVACDEINFDPAKVVFQTKEMALKKAIKTIANEERVQSNERSRLCLKS